MVEAVLVAVLSGSPRAAARGPELGEPDVPFPAEVELDWEAPDACPSAEQVRGRIGELLRAPPRGEGTVFVTARVHRDPGGFRLELSTDFRGRVEHRELIAPVCGELAEATAIVLAVALEPELGETLDTAEPDPAPERIPEPPPAVEPTPQPARPTPSAPVPTRTNASPPPQRHVESPPRLTQHTVRQTRLRVGAAGEFGMLPGVTGGPRLAVVLAWPRVRAELNGAYFAPRRDRLTRGGGALYQAGVVGGRACAVLLRGPVQLPLCGGIEGGAVRAGTRGFSPRRVRHGPWVGPLGSIGLTASWNTIGLWTALEAVVPAYRGEYEFAGEVGFVGLPVSGRVVFGFEIILP